MLFSHTLALPYFTSITLFCFLSCWLFFEGNNDETKFINITMILFSDRGGAGGYMSHDDSGVLWGVAWAGWLADLQWAWHLNIRCHALWATSA